MSVDAGIRTRGVGLRDTARTARSAFPQAAPSPRRPHVSPPTRAARRQRGFTLIEIVVVMTIIAAATLLAAMAVSGGFERMEIRSASKAIAANLRYARAQAIATGAPQRFVVDPGAHTWTGVDGRNGRIPDALSVRFFGAREVQPSRSEGAIVFFADGASTGGRVQLVAKNAAWNIDVAWLTGEIHSRRASNTAGAE